MFNFLINCLFKKTYTIAVLIWVTDFTHIHHTKIKEIEMALNNRPRKCLNFKTPLEIYTEMCGALSP
jgi:IS30 family transposase